MQKFIQINVLGLTFLLTSFLFESWKKKGEKKPWRMVVAHLSFSILGSLIALFAHSYHEDLAIGLIFLLEEAAILVGASLIQKRWMAIMSGVIIGFGGVYLTGLYKYTYGETTSFNEIMKLWRKTRRDFKDAFIVSFKDGQRMNY